MEDYSYELEESMSAVMVLSLAVNMKPFEKDIGWFQMLLNRLLIAATSSVYVHTHIGVYHMLICMYVQLSLSLSYIYI